MPIETIPLTPEQRAAVEARPAARQTPEYQEEVERDIAAYRREYPPVSDPDLIEALAGLRLERERQGLSLSDIAERTGINRATISRLETGKLPNPTIGTLRTYARALGRRLSWTLEPVATIDRRVSSCPFTTGREWRRGIFTISNCAGWWRWGMP